MKFHDLQSIDFSGNPIGISGLATLLDCCRGNLDLAELNLSHINLTDLSEKDYFTVCRVLIDFPSLQSLNLSDNNLSPELLKAVAAACSEHPCLSRLYLERNNITSSIAVDILRYFTGNVRLHTCYFGTSLRSRQGTSRQPLMSRIKSSLRVKSSQSLGDVLCHNFAIRNLQMGDAGSDSKVQLVLSQNEKLWSNREERGIGRVSLANRFINYVHPIVFTLGHLCELDLSGNLLEAVPIEITKIKGLQWLSFEKNEIATFAYPFQLLELKKLHHCNLAGNPLTLDLPKDVNLESWVSVSRWLQKLRSSLEEVEAQVAALCVSANGGDISKFTSDFEKFLKKGRPGLLKVARSTTQSTSQKNFVGKAVDKTLARGVSGSGNLSTSGSGSLRKKRGISLKNLHGSLDISTHCLLRECDPVHFAVHALFHRLILVTVDMMKTDWEASVNDLLTFMTHGSNSSSLPYVLMIVTNPGPNFTSTKSQAKLVSAVMQRMKKFGVQRVLICTQESEMLAVYEELSQATLALLDGRCSTLKVFPSTWLSIQNREIVAAPVLPMSRFSDSENSKLLKWAQTAGVASLPIGGHIYVNLEWAVGCMDVLLGLDTTVFHEQDLGVHFSKDLYSTQSRDYAMRLLESANVVVRTGWLQDQWILLAGDRKNEREKSLSLNEATSFSAPPPGAVFCTRLFNIVSPITEVSVSSVVKKLFLQTAGVLSEVKKMSLNGFSGILVLREEQYAVQISIERNAGLVVVVIVQSDRYGQIAHMVTTAIEKGLEEVELKFIRLCQIGKDDVEVDKVLNGLVAAKGRDQLQSILDSKEMQSLPDLKLLGNERLFWNELKLEGCIGKGSFGEVSLAKVSTLDSKVAVKKVNIRSGGGLAELREIVRELWVLYVLRHPNIVSPAGVCLDPLAICMEYVDLGDLRNFLDAHLNIPWSLKLSWLFDISGGMEYAHGRRPPLVHSDLKSPNILLCNKDGVVSAKIADLGLATFTSLNAATVVDNPLWSAPEMIQRSIYAPSVDVYSFAIIMWEICSGCFPFQAELDELDGNLTMLKEEILAGRRPDLTFIGGVDIPAKAVSLIQQCWSGNPSERPSFRQVMAELVVIATESEQEQQRQMAQSKSATTTMTRPLVISGLHPFLSSPMPMQPKTICRVSDYVAAIAADGSLWLFDQLSLIFVKTLGWNLTERVRVASSVSIDKTGYFVYGTDSLLILSETLAERRVVGDLTNCELMCLADGDVIWVAGRNEDGVAVQPFQNGTWMGTRGCNLGDGRAPVIAITAVGKEVWCVCVEKEESILYTFDAHAGDAAAKKTAIVGYTASKKDSFVWKKVAKFKERIVAIRSVGSGEDAKVWVCTTSWSSTEAKTAKVLSINPDTLEIVEELCNTEVRACHPLEHSNGVFGFSREHGARIYDASGKVLHTVSAAPKIGKSNDFDSTETVPIDTGVLQLSGHPDVVVVAAQSGLVSWRIERMEKSPPELLKPLRGATRPRNTSLDKLRSPVHVNSSGSSSSHSGSASPRARANTLHMTRNARTRATVTCDDQGRVVSANDGVRDIFGHDPVKLSGVSVRTLFFMPRTKQRTGSVLMFSKLPPQRFSASDLWKSLMEDLFQVRVVNGQKHDGTTVPLLISSSELVVGGRHLYVLLFEQMQKDCAILVVEDTGVIHSATDNIKKVLGWHAEQVSGKVINSVVTTPVPKKYMNARKFDPSLVITATGKSSANQTININLQVLDYSSRSYTIMVSNAAEREEEPVEYLNHYLLGKVLGSGMCGEVREATHKLTQGKVAIKRLKVKDFEDAGVKFSDMEIDLMRRLDHPNIVLLIDCVRMKDEICLVMELIQGEELFSYCLDQGPLPEDTSRNMFWDIVNAVEYIHLKGVVHRDLKLENCMLEEGRRIKIIDFGLGNLLANSPLSTSCGSPNYAAPELFLSRKYEGPPVDIWAMGVILFAMISGQFPFDEIQGTIESDFEWPLEVSSSLEDLVSSIFEVNPDLRCNMNQLKMHPWMTAGSSSVPHIRQGNSKDQQIQADIVSMMETEYAMPMELVVKSLKDNEINQYSATYKLLRSNRGKQEMRKVNPKIDQQVYNVLKKIEKDELELSIEAIRKRRDAGSPVSNNSSGGSPRLVRSTSGKMFIGSTRSRSRSKSGGSVVRSDGGNADGKEVLGGGLQQQAWNSSATKSPLMVSRKLQLSIPSHQTEDKK